MPRYAVRVTGTVQGVGFRPFVHGLARELGLVGHVGNDVEGVFIEVQGAGVDEFLRRLTAEAPPLASIEAVETHSMSVTEQTGFQIVASGGSASAAVTSIPPDTAVCPDCLTEVRDPGDRRFGYPFIACTNCGPRFTMVAGLPYDRENTSMVDFPLCAACRAEYTDPRNRRYHAQPTACWDCGPHLSTPVAELALVLRSGRIAAIKGVGGYHLACDATDHAVVGRLRERKQRGDKPFAVMVADMDHAQQIVELDDAARELMASSARPIVLAPSRDAALQSVVAPGNHLIGVMLAYTPLHHLLFDADAPEVLVMTSGNLTDEPICIDPGEAEQRLAGIAEVFCHHNRRIHVACDDSVARVVAGDVVPVRRSRGYVPAPLALPVDSPPMVAVGAEIKAAAAVATGRRAWLTQHIGDVENLETLQMLQRSIEILADLQRITPEIVISDSHPGYLSRRWAGDYAADRGIEHTTVQHHHAHFASLLAEHHIPVGEPVLGVVFDGTGYGTDGTIWGGELLLGSYDEVRRVGHLAPIQLPGGDAAIRFPSRIAASHLQAAGLDMAGTAPGDAMSAGDQRLLTQMLATGTHCTPTTSVGRLFDAVASLLDVRHGVDYEAQAAIELESLAAGGACDSWPVDVRVDGAAVVIDPGGWIARAVSDHRDGIAVSDSARGFHRGLADAVAVAACEVRRRFGVDTVGLSGGVFANAILTQDCLRALQTSGFTVLTHRRVPPNDGGLALGQVSVAAAVLHRR